jgi:RND family efflux transporter MFP subunit
MSASALYSLRAGLSTLSAVAALAGCSPAPHMPAPEPAQVSVVTLKAKPYTQVRSLPGRLTAYLSANVTPQVTGVIQQRPFTEGSDVKAGQLLYQLDPGTYQAAYDQAKANLANAEAALLSARPQAERDGELAKIDAISKQDLDNATATLRQDEATVLSDQASLTSARVNLAYTRIAAPISGRITTSAYTVGALVTANQSTALATIYQYDPIYVDVTQSSAQYLQLRQDLVNGRLRRDGSGAARITLTLEDGSTYAQEGTLQVVGVSVDQSTGTITLRGTVSNPDKLLLPNMYVHALLQQGVNQNALWVPQQGVTRDVKGNATALVVGAGSKVEQRTLQVSGTQGSDWIVESGLKVGDRVIVEGLQDVKIGDAVKPQELPPQSALTSGQPAAAPADAAKVGGH